MSLEDKFWLKVKKTESCWNWISSLNSRGYGVFYYNKTVSLSHRVSWKLKNGEIPEKLFVCHHCDNPKCINPSHLFLGTQVDNMKDCSRKGRLKNQKKVYCKRGHSLSGDNLFKSDVIRRKRRRCKTCENESRRIRRRMSRIIKMKEQNYDYKQ